jgi:MurNAc alpha-1-phosphate uridylyltransferase
MKVMILAAGRGERMRPLTDHTPKPLLQVAGKSLLQHHLERLSAAGFTDVIINLGHLGQQIRTALGDGQNYGVQIRYSQEPPEALETGGGIFQALPLLKYEPFAVLNSDIWCDYPWQQLPQPLGLGHLILVDNPTQNEAGDFALQAGQVSNSGPTMLTFSGISILRPELFKACSPGRFSLTPLLRQAAEQGQISGEHYRGRWRDIGTVSRLQKLEQELSGPPDASRLPDQTQSYQDQE